VREDLDQRIYFHELEDAVSYMARRGYARMEKSQEKEWIKLLKRAHEVVKVRFTCFRSCANGMFDDPLKYLYHFKRLDPPKRNNATARAN
jgi:hypothetical protein